MQHHVRQHHRFDDAHRLGPRARNEVRERIASQGGEVFAAPGEHLAAHIRKETALYAKVVQSSGIKPE